MIILHAEGQTCNRFFTYLNFIADSFETGEKIVILAPDVSFKDYPHLRNLNILKFPFYSDILVKLVGYDTYIKFLQKVLGNTYSLRFLLYLFKIFPSVRFIKAATGSYKSKKRFIHEIKLKQLFTPRFQIMSEVNSIFESKRTDFDLICGVHLRYGDYRIWLHGKYCYTEEQYHELMLNIKRLFPGRSIAFFISSNEKIDLSLFTDCNCFIITNSTPTKDLYGLSISDYIIGPPSTFSGWASYYGNTPLNFIENPNKEIELSSFKHISEIWN
ncbi:hypothetical protein OU798_23120 [Prolixibacteraceae bacterium Z1-6]|uniref:Glycosyl transferase family 11 n=1 Tax=Draconibacterium aestuarii TaxID=2998507 RepID=A0A9X3FHH5_9BACT|nr:hypothetical protein [Prolixibacteraceae bacterium Z1-6]